MELGDEKLTVALFEQFPIRRTWYNGEWWYSIIDCMGPLSGSPTPARYWSDLKRDLLAKEGFEVYAQGVNLFPMPDARGRKQKTDCANKAILLRLIQSVKSPNAEPFKQWLADLGAAELEKQRMATGRCARTIG
jgi:DNA-damage-inducible protein D